MKHVRSIVIMLSVALIFTLITSGIFNFMLYIKEWTFSFPTYIGFTIFASPLILYAIAIVYFLMWLSEEN